MRLPSIAYIPPSQNDFRFCSIPRLSQTRSGVPSLPPGCFAGLVTLKSPSAPGVWCRQGRSWCKTWTTTWPLRWRLGYPARRAESLVGQCGFRAGRTRKKAASTGNGGTTEIWALQRVNQWRNADVVSLFSVTGKLLWSRGAIFAWWRG